MSYTITTTAGVTLATIADGTVNSSATSLTLIGKNYAGYGVFLNENYVKLLENFSNSTAPAAPLNGQLWFDSSTNVLKVRSQGEWKAVSSSASGNTQPTNPVVGDLWWNSNTSQLNVWSGSAWIIVGPTYTSTTGTSGAVVESILDSSSGSHVVVKFYISNTVIGILSRDSSFTPQTAINGFTTIKPGFNLASSSAITGSQFTGDASNALSLNGVLANQFLRSDADTSTLYKIGAGSLGVGSDLTVTAVTGTVSLTNGTTNGDLNFWVKGGSGSVKAIGITGSSSAVTLASSLTVGTTATVTGNLTASSYTNLQGVTVVSNTVLPSAANTINIGATGTKFANIYAGALVGNVFGNVTGVSSSALYADLAERFEADAPMIPGTVVEIGGVKEVTKVVQELSESVFGVISTAAAYLMNAGAGSNTTHPAIAVNGRVPVRVVGTVKKGDRLVSAGNGLARSASRQELTAFNVIGRALADKTTSEEGLVEAIVKLNS